MVGRPPRAESRNPEIHHWHRQHLPPAHGANQHPSLLHNVATNHSRLECGSYAVHGMAEPAKNGTAGPAVGSDHKPVGPHGPYRV